MIDPERIDGAAILEQPFRDLHETGLLLAGVNTEVRALFMGSLATFGCKMQFLDVHHHLVKRGAAELHAFAPTHTRAPLKTSPKELFARELPNEDDTVELSQFGEYSASLGGFLLEDISLHDSVALIRLMSGNKQLEGHTVLPATIVRFAIYSILLGSKRRGIAVGELNSRFGVLDITEKTVRKHLLNIEEMGMAVNDGSKLAVRRLTKQGNERARKYTETVRSFLSNPDSVEEGLHKAIRVLWDRGRMPFLVKRSLLNSGKCDAPRTEEINQELRLLFQSLSPEVLLSTSEVASLLGISAEIASVALLRVAKNFNGRSAIRLSPYRTKKKERLWQSAPRTDGEYLRR